MDHKDMIALFVTYMIVGMIENVNFIKEAYGEAKDEFKNNGVLRGTYNILDSFVYILFWLPLFIGISIGRKTKVGSTILTATKILSTAILMPFSMIVEKITKKTKKKEER